MASDLQHGRDATKQAQRIRLLEEALAEYALRYGISDKTREVFQEFPERASG